MYSPFIGEYSKYATGIGLNKSVDSEVFESPTPTTGVAYALPIKVKPKGSADLERLIMAKPTS
jgi:hypothetical protein